MSDGRYAEAERCGKADEAGEGREGHVVISWPAMWMTVQSEIVVVSVCGRGGSRGERERWEGIWLTKLCFRSQMLCF